MDQRHLKLPVQFGSFLSGADMPRCRQAGESIAQHIQMLLTTRPGENRFDTGYGCAIWDLDFELIISEGTWKETFRLSVIESVRKYEQRIEQVFVDIGLNNIERFGFRGQPEIRRKATVFIKAKIVETGEPFTFKTELMLSPLSIE
jgi:phage baseplate assembly protein W